MDRKTADDISARAVPNPRRPRLPTALEEELAGAEQRAADYYTKLELMTEEYVELDDQIDNLEEIEEN